MSCCMRRGCVDNEHLLYETPEAAKYARMRDKQITRILKEYHREDLRKLKILLLGTGESGKSTITKQMKILHINGFDTRERISKIADIRQNIKESIVEILSAMQNLGISLELDENKPRMEYILREAGNSEIQMEDEFMDNTEHLWGDAGVRECYSRSHEYQLLDSAKYFLDRVEEIRKPDYIPSDQDILRCRVVTTSIQHIQFDVADAGNPVQFSVFDVGGQRGERKKWIQVFDSVVAIQFLADCSSYDQNLREDPSKNRLLEALEIFEQVWRNRFLKYVSILLFLNKIDILAEKVAKGRSIKYFADKYSDKLPDFEKFTPSHADRSEFVSAYNKFEHRESLKRRASGSGANSQQKVDQKKRRGSRAGSKSTEVNPDLIKTATYIKHLFVKIVTGDLVLIPSVQEVGKDWHRHHTCEYFYTCAVDTNNVQRVLEGCRTLIIRKHLERFGII